MLGLYCCTCSSICWSKEILEAEVSTSDVPANQTPRALNKRHAAIGSSVQSNTGLYEGMPIADRILTPWAKLRHSTMHLCFISVSAMRQQFHLWSATARAFIWTKKPFPAEQRKCGGLWSYQASDICSGCLVKGNLLWYATRQYRFTKPS